MGRTLGRCIKSNIVQLYSTKATDENRKAVCGCTEENNISLFSLNGIPYVTSVSRNTFGRYAAARPPCSMANVSTKNIEKTYNKQEIFSKMLSYLFYQFQRVL